MVQSELRLAASLGLAMRVIVFVDHSLNRIELKQGARGYASTGTIIEGTDIVRMAESMGCQGLVATTHAQLDNALGVMPVDRPVVIGVSVDPAQYEAQF